MLTWLVWTLLALEPGEQSTVECSGALATGTELTYDQTRFGSATVTTVAITDSAPNEKKYGAERQSKNLPAVRGTLAGARGQFRVKLATTPITNHEYQLLVTFTPVNGTRTQVWILDCTHN